MAFPTSTLGLIVELALGANLTADPSTWSWTDVTSYVFTGEVGISITRGRADGVSDATASTCEFAADNRDGRWVPTNPTGAWYGQITKGTPVRVKTTESSTSVRWTGFLTSLPPRWDVSENDRYVQVQASGILQRLDRGATPLRSPLVRTISGTSTAPVAYWPGEDGSNATSIAEFFGGNPMTFSGTLTPSSAGPDGSEPLPEFTTLAGLTGLVPQHETTGTWSVGFVFNVASAPTGDTVIFRWKTSGSLPTWQIVLNPIGGTDTLTLEAYDSTGTLQLSDPTSFVANSTVEAYGEWLLLVADVVTNGTDLNYSILWYGGTGGTGSFGTLTSQTAGRVTSVSVPATAKTNGILHEGHWAAWNINTDLVDAFELDPAALDGYAGESVGIRIARLSGETATIDGAVWQFGSDLSNNMGAQGRDTFLSLIRECEAVNNGRLIEVMDPVALDSFLAIHLNSDLSNQTAALTLNHNSKHLSPPFEPVDDDQYLRNDWTATRAGGTGSGSSARAVADSGNLTPAKVGTYADSVEVNVQTDDQLADQAGWRLNLGTVEGLRVPSVTLDLSVNTSLIASWIACDLGSRITITNPPAGIAPDQIDLMLEGYTEVFGPYAWSVTMNCSPYKPWHVFELANTTGDTDAFLGRLAGDEKCALRVAINSTDTSMVVDPNRYRWTTDADDFPLNVRLGGEVVTVSSIATAVATFVAVGAASHADNTAVTPALYAGATTRHLIVVVAAIRSSGTGTLLTPTGYTRLPVFAAADNVQIFAKVHSGSESNPTVTPSGGAAGDTVSAFTFGLGNMPNSLADLGDVVVDSIPQLNASAQNISYGGLYSWQVAGCVQLVVGWKQDDYTSVTPPAGFTEMIEASTTTGNDQSLYCAYRIDTTPAVVNGGSLAVTGGASAISRSAVFALAGGTQTFTLSARSVNGVVKAQTVGTKIEVEDAAVLAP